MKHSQIQNQLSAYFDDSLSPRDCERVEGHLRTCNECAEILSDFKQNGEWIADLRRPQSSTEGIWAAIQGQIADGSQKQAKHTFHPDLGYIWRRWIFRPASAGIGTLATVCLVLALVYLNPTQQPLEDALDLYLMVHAEYATQNPLTPDIVADSFVITDSSDEESSDDAFLDDTEVVLDTYLDAYFGD